MPISVYMGAGEDDAPEAEVPPERSRILRSFAAARSQRHFWGGALKTSFATRVVRQGDVHGEPVAGESGRAMERSTLEGSLKARRVRADVQATTAVASRDVAHEPAPIGSWQRDEPPE